MKWISPLVALTAVTAVMAAPFVKRASVQDVATVGFATLNGGTTGGSGGTVIDVSTLAQLKSAVTGDSKKIVVVSGTITGAEAIKVGSNTSIIGKSGATLTGVGLRVNKVKNVIIRNLKVEKVVAPTDAIAIQESHQVWVDHVDLSSDRDHDKDFYDGLLDVTHGCTGISLTNNKLHDHFKASLVGHSDNNGSEDKAITVTYAGNHFLNLNSRTPSFRFGTGHLFNNFFENCNDGINTRQGAQLLVENNVFSGLKKPLYSTDGGFAVARGNDFGGASNTAPAGQLTSVPYKYDLAAVGSVKAAAGSAGATLSF